MYWLNFVREFYRPTGQTHPAPFLASAQRKSPESPKLVFGSVVAAALVSPSLWRDTISSASTEETASSPDNAVEETQAALAAEQAEMVEIIEELEEKIASLTTQLAMTEQSRAAFLSSMSHELRTPLNAIMGFSDMMKTGVFGEIENPTYAQYVQHIHDSGTLLLTKINDLLDIASIQSQGMDLEMEAFSLEGLMEDVLAMHSHAAFSRHQAIRLDTMPHVMLEADRSKLLCALSHMVGNALRHSAEGATIELRVRAHYEDGVTISVHDTGEGIAEQQLKAMRTALRHDHSYRGIEPGGLGIGLALAKEIAASHGARLMLDSMRHRGTVVSMTLPPARVKAGLPYKRARVR